MSAAEQGERHDGLQDRVIVQGRADDRTGKRTGHSASGDMVGEKGRHDSPARFFLWDAVIENSVGLRPSGEGMRPKMRRNQYLKISPGRR